MNPTSLLSCGLSNADRGMWHRRGVASRACNLLAALTFLLIAFAAPSENAFSQSAQTQDHPDRLVQEGVPKGEIKKGVFETSEIYPGTRREYSVYIPKQYDPAQPAALMVFQDGQNYANPEGPFRVPVVFDNLIHQKAMPVTITIFVAPGSVKGEIPGAKDRSTRSFEYDSMGDRYTRFLLDEFLPVALKDLNVSTDPKQRAIGGISSGAIAAFTVAWERPDQFGKVLSHIGSYTNIRGGWAYPGLVRKTKRNPKPIKVYLQEGKDDLNNLFGNWPLANQDLAAALQFAGYEHQLVMTEGGHSGNWAGKELPEALKWLWNDKPAVKEEAKKSEQVAVPNQSKWEPHPDAIANEKVPTGTIEKFPGFESKIFENTVRDWAIYVPAQVKPTEPAAVMVFQDGHSYMDPKGRWRVPIVFDNLIAKGEMPPTIAVFINPGHDTRRPKPDSPWKASNRGYEYDSLGDRYTQFLLTEILPQVEAKYALSKDPEMRAVCGASSGGICSFTVAWERPDQFRKVLSTIGSFTNLRGGNVYPSLIRKTEPKPIRVYLADTSGDLDNPFGNWPLSNKLMHSALAYMGYDVRFDWAEGYAHNADHGGMLFPEALRWLWRKEKHEPKWSTKDDLKGDLTLLKLLVPGQGWEVVAKELGFADAPCVDSQGQFYFSDMRAPAIYRVSPESGEKVLIAKEAVSGLEFSADGKLYGCQGAKNRLVSIDPVSGNVQVVAEGVTPNDLAVSSNGFAYITETKEGRVTKIELATGKVSVADTGINRPNGIAISPDGGTLAVSEYGGKIVWMYRLKKDGGIDSKMPVMELRAPIDPKGEFAFNEAPPYLAAAAGDGMAVDRAGRYYVTSSLGVQVFDPTGRMCGVLPKPIQDAPLTSCVLGGPEGDWLFVTNGSTVLRRKLTIE